MIKPGLYIVAVPIGNARDISFRALDTLSSVDLILCEDTRVTRKLILQHKIQTRVNSYHEHNASRIRPKIIERLMTGERIALVCDAGTPLINDPGFKLVTESLKENVSIFSLPGPSAVTNALVLSGLPTDRFLFVGYPPTKSKKRCEWLKQLAIFDATLIFLESARGLPSFLNEMYSIFGQRQIAVAREMTKLYEEINRGTLKDLTNFYISSGPPKGEITLVVEGAEKAGNLSDQKITISLKLALKTVSLKDASEIIATATGYSRRKIYSLGLKIKAEDDN